MMKKSMIRIAAILCLGLSVAYAQDTSDIIREYKFTASYGINFIQPDEINKHIISSNDLMGSSAQKIRSIPEIAVSLSTLLTGDHLIITGRISRMYIARTYDINIPETTTSTDIIGYSTGTIQEIYTIYPLSIGLGLASKTLRSQINLEYVYALGYIDEKQSYTSSVGTHNSYSETYSSSANGIRFAGSTTLCFTERIGLTIEASYHYFVLKDYSSDLSDIRRDIHFQVKGLSTAIGLSILF